MRIEVSTYEGRVNVVTLTIPVSVCGVETVVGVGVVPIHGMQLCEATKYLWLVSELFEGMVGFDGWGKVG